MSLKSQPIYPVPQETARVARAAYPKGNIYMQMREVLGSIYADEDFAALFPKEGQPADRSVAMSSDHRVTMCGEPI
jgi:transposase